MGGASYPSNPNMSRPEPVTVCVEPSCPTLVKHGIRCPQHAIPDRRGSRGYSTAIWQKARNAYLRGHPQCEHVDPAIDERGLACSPRFCLSQATEVDHIDGLGPRSPRGTDPTNLRSYCKHHHSKRTARDHPPGSRTLRGVA